MRFAEKGLKAGCVTKESSSEEKKVRELVFFSPEDIVSTWRSVIQSKPYRDNVVALVIVHRGESFRTEYTQLRSVLPRSINIMALTATATKSQKQAITSE